MKKSKKKLKGMTLIEMIISIFIFAIMGGLLILVGTHIDATSKAANNLKNKVVVESPYAANHYSVVGTDEEGKPKKLKNEEMDITVKISGVSGKYYVYNEETKAYDEKSYGETGAIQVDLKADKYSTEELVTAGMTEDQINDMRSKSNGKLNLDFFDIRPAEEPEESEESEETE